MLCGGRGALQPLAADDAPGELYHGQGCKSCILSLGMPSLTAWLVLQTVYFNFLPLSHWPAEIPHSLICDLTLRLVRSDCSGLTTGDRALCWPGFRPSETHSCISPGLCNEGKHS